LVDECDDECKQLILVKFFKDAIYKKFFTIEHS
jgi:hypothetical protein